METIKLRPHHIINLRDYNNYRSRKRLMETCYGKEHAEREGQVYDGILEGKTPVTVVDIFDDICENCPKRVEAGCFNLYNEFQPVEKLAKEEEKFAEWYHVEIGETYDGEEFLDRALAKNVGSKVLIIS